MLMELVNAGLCKASQEGLDCAGYDVDSVLVEPTGDAIFTVDADEFWESCAELEPATNDNGLVIVYINNKEDEGHLRERSGGTALSRASAEAA